MATIYEVSKLAGVSLATVSRVMNDSGRVTSKTRDKVIAAMQELDYRPNTVAQSLASNRSNCVGVLVSEVYGPVFGELLSGIEDELSQSGKFTLFATGHSDAEKEREAINFLISRNCDALILHVEALSDEYLLAQQNGELPFVLVNRSVPGLEDSCIVLDNEKGGYDAAEFLLGQGHRDIAYISGPLDWSDASLRLTGHKRAVEENGQRFDERLLVEGDYSEAAGGDAMQQLLDADIPFTAVVCANDDMAAGVLEIARANGISVPEDLSIVGFDNSPVSRYVHPKLSTINFPVREIGCMAAHWVLQNVYGGNGLDLQNVFEPSVVHRASACPPKES